MSSLASNSLRWASQVARGWRWSRTGTCASGSETPRRASSGTASTSIPSSAAQTTPKLYKLLPANNRACKETNKHVLSSLSVRRRACFTQFLKWSLVVVPRKRFFVGPYSRTMPRACAPGSETPRRASSGTASTSIPSSAAQTTPRQEVMRHDTHRYQGSQPSPSKQPQIPADVQRDE